MMENQKRFLTALSVDEFESLMDKTDCKVNLDENIQISDALSRVLSEQISSAIDVPPFRKSKVDGYAVKSEDTFGAGEEKGAVFNVVGEVEMGKGVSGSIRNGEVMYVPTGGMIPDGADAVVKVEYTRKIDSDSGRKLVEIFSPVTPNQSILPAGSDLKSGSIFLEKNSYLTVARLGSLAAAGITSIRVYEKIKVGLFSSGNEIVEPGSELAPGKIYDVNSLTIKSLIKRSGCNVNYYGILGDDFDSLNELVSRALNENDVVICSGGTSKGRGDLMPLVIERNPGTSLEVHGVKIKPGKPLIFSLIGGKPLFVLAGNPTSAMMTYMRLVDPFLRRNNRLPPRIKQIIKANLSTRVYSEFGRRELKPVTNIRSEAGELQADPVPKGSETITTLLNATGYFEIPENVELMEKGELIDVVLLE